MWAFLRREPTADVLEKTKAVLFYEEDAEDAERSDMVPVLFSAIY